MFIITSAVCASVKLVTCTTHLLFYISAMNCMRTRVHELCSSSHDHYILSSFECMQQSGKMHEEEVAKIGNEYITVNIPSDDPNDWKTLRGDPNLNPYSHLGDLEPANLIKFAFQISSGMVC